MELAEIEVRASARQIDETRHELALEHLEDLRRIDEQMRASKRRLADAVRAARTTVTEVFGFGPVGAAIAVGQARDVSRFADRDHHIAAITQIRHAHSPGRAFYDRKLAEGKTKKEAIRALKRRISDTLYHGSSPMPLRTQVQEGKRGRLHKSG